MKEFVHEKRLAIREWGGRGGGGGGEREIEGEGREGEREREGREMGWSLCGCEDE